MVNRAEALSDLYEKALDAIMRSLNADRASILLFDRDGVLRFEAWQGLSEGYRRAVEGHSPWKRDARSPDPILVPSIAEAGLEPHLKDVVSREGIGALAFIPLTYGGRLLGKFMVYFDRPYTMHPDEVELAQAIGLTLALGIERQLSEDLLKHREGQLRLALEAGRMGSWEWTIGTNRVTWSPGLEAIHGLEPGSFDGTFDGFQKDIHPGDLQRVLGSIARSLEQDEHHHVEYRIVRPDGAIHWLEGRGKLVRDGNGAPTRMIGVCTDITERKQAEQALRESEEKLRKLAGQLEELVAERTAKLEHSQTRLLALAAETELDGAAGAAAAGDRVA
jgi:PAS domain S-box-containing protein